MKTVLCAVAGASGGHIIPGIKTLKTVAQEYHDPELLFFSTRSVFDRDLIEEFATSFSYCSLPIIPIPGKKVWRYPLFLFRLVQSFWLSYRVLSKKRPEKLVSMGGLVSLPVCVAAWCIGCEITLFELNAVPGKAVRWLAPLATSVQVCFKEAEIFFDPAKVIDVPYPLRYSSRDILSKEEACGQLRIEPSKKVLLVLGGSQGSRALNSLMYSLCEESPDRLKDCTVVHQAGASFIDGVSVVQWLQQFYTEQGIDSRVFSFTHKLSLYYSAADLIVARAGAGTLCEIEFFNKRAVLIPLEYVAESHQLDNAVVMMDRRPDLFSLVRQECAFHSSAQFNDHLITLLKQPERLR